MRKLTSWLVAGRKPALAVPKLPLDLLAPDFLADPTPIYAWLRDNAPLAPIRSGGYIMTRAADVQAAFTDPRLGNAPSRFSMLAEKNRAKHTAASVAANIPPFLDKPRHIELRKPLSSAFYNAFAGADKWLLALADAHAAGLKGKGPVDAITHFARPFASEAMARFVGIPFDPTAIATATAALFKLFAPITDRADFDAVNSGLEATRDMIAAAVTFRRTHADASLISFLLASRTMSDEEIADNALLVLADGIENIEAAIAQVLRYLGRPEHDTILDSAEMTQVVAEVLRLETPAQTIPRIVRDAHQRDGVELSEGTPIFLALGSAHRDPAWYLEPDRFDASRDQSKSMVFGQGRHRCIGAPLASLLVVTGVQSLVSRSIEVLDQDVTFAARLGHRWPIRLMVDLP